jgi:hypothetical protein
MSRGPGLIQRAILALITSDSNGAWTTSDICQHVYGKTFKRQRVAVLRAMRSVTLPEGWALCHLWLAGSELCIVNQCSLESMLRKRWCEDWRQWLFVDADKYSFEEYRASNYAEAYADRFLRKDVDQATRYRDGTPAERRDIEIERATKLLNILGWDWPSIQDTRVKLAGLRLQRARPVNKLSQRA